MGSRAKKLVLGVVGLTLAVLVLEAGAAVVYWRVHGKPLSRSEVQSRLDGKEPGRVAAVSKPNQRIPGHVTNKLLHPYLGFVLAPRDASVNDFGFYGVAPLVKRTPDSVHVAIMGGSVARSFAGEGAEPLAETLQTVPRFQGRRIVFVVLSVDGYKQPQQLLLLTWLLSLGAQFDILINLDGFNEVALPYGENVPAGVSVSFPRAWNLYVSQSFQPETALQVANIVRLRDQRASLRRLFRRFPLRHSVFCLTLWDELDRRWNATLTAEDSKLRGLVQSSNSDPSVLGPVEPNPTDERVFRDSVQIWHDSSLQMANLCRDNGIEYYHFLQPNQYVADSKRLSDEEKRVAFSDRLRYRVAVERAYPLLQAKGRELRARGVAFLDLTPVYKSVPETIYIDDCCHVNERGNRIMAREIAGMIAQGVGRGPEAKPR